MLSVLSGMNQKGISFFAVNKIEYDLCVVKLINIPK